VKFLPSAARYGFARLFSAWDGSAFANGADRRASSS